MWLIRCSTVRLWLAGLNPVEAGIDVKLFFRAHKLDYELTGNSAE
jgi:hypothetical protein